MMSSFDIAINRFNFLIILTYLLQELIQELNLKTLVCSIRNYALFKVAYIPHKFILAIIFIIYND